MRIAAIAAEQHAEFLELVNAEIRPAGAATRAQDDFPLILAPDNLGDSLGVSDENGRLVAGLATLIRDHETSCGRLAIAGIGSVVTRADRRGQGLSSRLQTAVLEHLRRKNVPLAVLWTDQPEIYSGRGFTPAGWEWHVVIPPASDLGSLPSGFRQRPYRGSDADAVAALYELHPLRTLRRPHEASRLYGMPGTRGIVAAGEDDRALAAVFCGKGADFPGYVAEWDGPLGLVVPLLAEACRQGLAQRVLVPAGGEALLEKLVAAGGGWFAQPSGCWAVVDGEALRTQLATQGHRLPSGPGSVRALLGSVAADGRPEAGPLHVGVWGFDSV